MNKRQFLGLLLSLTCAGCASRPRPQDPPDRPYPHRSVQLPGPAGVLAGELVLPSGGAPAPAVLLIAGSGPQDRDETVAGHRPFLVLSDALARAGIASLRMDKRGVGQSGGDFGTATITDFARDAGAAFDWLRGQPGIDPARVAMLGHSEGGLTAPLAAVGRDVAALVLMAGPGVPMDRVIRRQSAALAARNGASPAEIGALDQALAGAFDALHRAASPALARPGVLEALRPLPRPLRHHIQSLLATPWGHDAIRHDPIALLAAVPAPILALFGGTDMQVDATENARALRPLAQARPDHAPLEVVVFEGLNHLFQRSDSSDPDDYARIATTIEPEVLARLIRFLHQTTISPNKRQGGRRP